MKKLSLILSLILYFAFNGVAAGKAPIKQTLPSGGFLHIYPAESATATAAIIMCPGGGYDHLAIRHEGHDMAQWFNEQGITYAVLEYRLPKQPGDRLPMTDAHEALSFLSANADSFGIDENKIGIMGGSAGGHLASYIANTDPNVAFQILLYPVISMNDEFGHGGSRVNLLGKETSQELRDRYSTEKMVTRSTPKAFIVLSTDDRDVSPINSLRYYEALISNGVSAELHAFPSGGHGWGFKETFPHKQEWLSTMSAWLHNL